MAVYVDSLMDHGWRYGPSCHLFADSLPELHDFAQNKLGLLSRWFQTPKTGRRLPHYDLTKGNHYKAIRLGAILLDHRQAVVKWDELGYDRKPKRKVG
jgi:hypothetical protein